MAQNTILKCNLTRRDESEVKFTIQNNGRSITYRKQKKKTNEKRQHLLSPDLFGGDGSKEKKKK